MLSIRPSVSIAFDTNIDDDDDDDGSGGD